jgi:hypothetical protein
MSDLSSPNRLILRIEIPYDSRPSESDARSYHNRRRCHRPRRRTDPVVRTHRGDQRGRAGIAARYPDINQDADDDPTDGPVLDALSAEWHEIKRRIADLSITTMAGADAAGRAAMPESRQEPEHPGIEAQPTGIYDLLALELVEYHAGRADFAAGMQDGSCRQPLLAIEEPLRSLTVAAALLGHLSVTELEIEGDEIAAVQTMVSGAQAAIARSWQLAREQRQADEEARAAVLVAHAGELEVVRAQKAAPGSVADVKTARASWWLLQRAAETALKMCEARPAEEQEAGAAEGVALPPGGGMR